MSACRSVPGPAHQEVEPSVLLTGAVNGNDVRMFDRRGHPGLPFEPRAEVRVRRPLGGDELQRDGTVVLGVDGMDDLGRSLTPENLDDLVPVGDEFRSHRRIVRAR